MMHPATAQLIMTMLAMQEQCIAAIRGAIAADQYKGPSPITAAERAKEIAKSGAEPQYCSSEEEQVINKQMAAIFEDYRADIAPTEVTNEQVSGESKPV